MFMNHMDNQLVERSNRIGQVWFARENGRKFIPTFGPLTLRDNNFESRQSMTLESEMEIVGATHYDTESKRVDYGDILWVKCSFWG